MHPSVTRLMLLSTLFVASLASAAAPPRRYMLRANNTVYDTRTKLTWQHDLDPGKYTQVEAIQFCDSLQLAGLHWRLPTRAELLTLIDPTTWKPSIDVRVFPNTFVDQYWTSSPDVSDSLRGWRIDFDDGRSFVDFKTYAARVRCVH